MDDTAKTTLIVNGERHEVSAHPETPIVFVLRNDLGLKGVRAGCAVGVCGACTVLADGKPIRSCDTPVSAVAGAELLTPEGLGTPGRPHPVQQAFIDEQAAQCGYCINGIIMSTAAAAAGDAPEDVEAVGGAGPHAPGWLSEHMCRCGTHHRVVRAVDRVMSRAGDSDGTAAAAHGQQPAGSQQAATEAHGEPGGSSGAGAGAVPAGVEPRAVGDLPKDRVESWIALRPDGLVEARTGKVELGQGIRTAIAQIVASQLDLPLDCVVVPPSNTSVTTNERYTSGSNSIDTGGRDIGAATVAFRRLLLARAADALRVDAAELTLGGGGVVTRDGRGVSLAELAAKGPVSGQIEPEDKPDWSRTPLGRPIHRHDLVNKLTGAGAYVHDLELPGMLHARALLPPTKDSEHDGVDVASVESMPGVVHVLVDDRLVIVVTEREEQAVRALARLESTRWETPEGEVDSTNVFEAMRAMKVGGRYVESEPPEGSMPPDGEATHAATYTTPYQAHAAIAPSCAVAHEPAGVVRVYSHTQGVHPTRAAIAGLLDRPIEGVEVVHRDGPGCYGFNLSDDAAAFAALATVAVGGRPVRFQFTSEQEFAWEPLGPAMVADLSATVDDQGRLRAWRHHTITDSHSTRPGGRANRLIPAWLSGTRAERDWGGPGQGGARNSTPLYDLPALDAVAAHVQGPLRTGPLRTLGAFLNTFASESFMDEMAERAGVDPLEFRLAHLSDERARAVLQRVVTEAGYEPHVGPSGRGLGLGLARYHGTKAYVAQAVEATVDPETAEVTIRRLVLACDAGAIVNPDGAANQLEGGTVQALSRALREEVAFDRRGAVTSDWLGYQVLGLTFVPPIEVHLLDVRTQPPLGVGEAALGPAAAALANAIDDATGIRLRSLPFTPKRILDRLYSMDERESVRVLT